jgi:hypothetical protein
MLIIELLKIMKFNRRGGPILEEILLIGIAILIFAIIFGVIFGMVDWATTSIGDLFK